MNENEFRGSSSTDSIRKITEKTTHMHAQMVWLKMVKHRDEYENKIKNNKIDPIQRLSFSLIHTHTHIWVLAFASCTAIASPSFKKKNGEHVFVIIARWFFFICCCFNALDIILYPVDNSIYNFHTPKAYFKLFSFLISHLCRSVRRSHSNILDCGKQNAEKCVYATRVCSTQWNGAEQKSFKSELRERDRIQLINYMIN